MPITKSNCTTVHLITANVATCFEQPQGMLLSWLDQILMKVRDQQPGFVAIHCQEVGGKNYHKPVTSSQTFLQLLLQRSELDPYTRSLIYLDEDVSAADKFTALGSCYFIHKNAGEVLTWNFHERQFVPVEGRQLFTGCIENVPTKEKAKFPQEFFPECKWSRKGFMRTRWNINGTHLDLVNIHLFHDASNLVAMSQFPSVYSLNRRRALHHTLDRLHNDDLENIPFFMFGDFNFRLDTKSVVEHLTRDCTSSWQPSKRPGEEERVYRSAEDGVHVLTLSKRSFKHKSHQTIFSAGDWLRTYDREPESFTSRLREMPITFPPSYPFVEEFPRDSQKNKDTEISKAESCEPAANNVVEKSAVERAFDVVLEECGTSRHYAYTRLPGWCDRVMISITAHQLIKQTEHLGVTYHLLGMEAPMGDHKPVCLVLHLLQHSGALTCCSPHTGPSCPSFVHNPAVHEQCYTPQHPWCLCQHYPSCPTRQPKDRPTAQYSTKHKLEGRSQGDKMKLLKTPLESAKLVTDSVICESVNDDKTKTTSIYTESSSPDTRKQSGQFPACHYVVNISVIDNTKREDVHITKGSLDKPCDNLQVVEHVPVSSNVPFHVPTIITSHTSDAPCCDTITCIDSYAVFTPEKASNERSNLTLPLSDLTSRGSSSSEPPSFSSSSSIDDGSALLQPACPCEDRRLSFLSVENSDDRSCSSGCCGGQCVCSSDETRSRRCSDISVPDCGAIHCSTQQVSEEDPLSSNEGDSVSADAIISDGKEYVDWVPEPSCLEEEARSLGKDSSHSHDSDDSSCNLLSDSTDEELVENPDDLHTTCKEKSSKLNVLNRSLTYLTDKDNPGNQLVSLPSASYTSSQSLDGIVLEQSKRSVVGASDDSKSMDISAKSIDFSIKSIDSEVSGLLGNDSLSGLLRSRFKKYEKCVFDPEDSDGCIEDKSTSASMRVQYDSSILNLPEDATDSNSNAAGKATEESKPSDAVVWSESTKLQKEAAEIVRVCEEHVRKSEGVHSSFSSRSGVEEESTSLTDSTELTEDSYFNCPDEILAANFSRNRSGRSADLYSKLERMRSSKRAVETQDSLNNLLVSDCTSEAASLVAGAVSTGSSLNGTSLRKASDSSCAETALDSAKENKKSYLPDSASQVVFFAGEDSASFSQVLGRDVENNSHDLVASCYASEDSTSYSKSLLSSASRPQTANARSASTARDPESISQTATYDIADLESIKRRAAAVDAATMTSSSGETQSQTEIVSAVASEQGNSRYRGFLNKRHRRALATFFMFRHASNRVNDRSTAGVTTTSAPVVADRWDSTASPHVSRRARSKKCCIVS